jgi:valyl-tRNA synthetase
VEIWVPLGDVIDVDIEKARLNKEITKIEHLLKRSTAKVENPEFISKAPPDVVAKEKEKIEQLTESMAKLKQNLSVLLGS